MNLDYFKNELEFYNPCDQSHRALVQKLAALCYKGNHERITAQDVGQAIQAIINPNEFDAITGNELDLIRQLLDCDNPTKEIFLDAINAESNRYRKDQATPIIPQKGAKKRLSKIYIGNSQIFDA